MAFDGNGNFVRLHNWQLDAANGVDINAGEMDGEDNGFAAGLTNCVTRDGQGKMTADFLPATPNALNCGSVAAPWASFNGVPVSQFLNGTFYARTGAEITAGFTPTPAGSAYPPGWLPRYMTMAQLTDWLAGTAAVSQLSAFTNAYNVAMAGVPHGFVYAPAGKYLIPSPGLSWTNQNDIRLYGDGPNNTVLTYSGSNYTILTISADTGAGTTGTNLTLTNFDISANAGTGVSALSIADYLGFKLDNLQLYSSGNSLKMAGMAVGEVDNVNALTAGTNSAGNSSLLLTTDTLGIGNGPIHFGGGCNFNGQSNVTAGGAIWSQKSFGIVMDSPLVTALGSALTSVCAFTNNDDITINGGYSESGRNTTADTAVLFDLGATAACQNFKLNGGTYFTGASGHYLKYAINAHNTQALSVDSATFANFATAGIKYVLSAASMVEIKNTYSSGAGNPPVLDASVGGPASGYLKSWSDPWPRLDASLVATVANVTGDGTVYTVLFDTTNFDTTAMYAPGTGIATIPAQSGGMYDVSGALMINGLSAAWTGMEMDIVQKNQGGGVVSTHAISTNPGAVRNAANQASLSQNCLLKCAGGDQIYMTVQVSGSTKNIGVVGSATEYTRMSLRFVG